MNLFKIRKIRKILKKIYNQKNMRDLILIKKEYLTIKEFAEITDQTERNTRTRVKEVLESLKNQQNGNLLTKKEGKKILYRNRLLEYFFPPVFKELIEEIKKTETYILKLEGDIEALGEIKRSRQNRDHSKIKENDLRKVFSKHMANIITNNIISGEITSFYTLAKECISAFVEHPSSFYLDEIKETEKEIENVLNKTENDLFKERIDFIEQQIENCIIAQNKTKQALAVAESLYAKSFTFISFVKMKSETTYVRYCSFLNEQLTSLIKELMESIIQHEDKKEKLLLEKNTLVAAGLKDKLLEPLRSDQNYYQNKRKEEEDLCEKNNLWVKNLTQLIEDFVKTNV